MSTDSTRLPKGFKQSDLQLPEDEHGTPLVEMQKEAERKMRASPSVAVFNGKSLTPRTTTVRNLRASSSSTRDAWAPKALRGWLALRENAGWFGWGRTWVPYWCTFDSRYLLFYVRAPHTSSDHEASGYSVTTLDPGTQRITTTYAPPDMTNSQIPIPSLVIDLALSAVEAVFESGTLYAIIRRENYPDYVLCGKHINYWIHEFQKINTVWTDETGNTLDVPTDVVDKNGHLMEPKMDSAERFFLRQQGAFLLYMHGPLQFEAWNSRLGGKWFLHFCTFDAYDPIPKLVIFSDCREPSDATPPKILNLTGAVVTEHLDSRKRSKMKIELPGKPPLICDGPNIQWWLGALQWATRDKKDGKSMFRDLIKQRRFLPIERSLSVLRLQRRSSLSQMPKNDVDTTVMNAAPRNTISAGPGAETGANSKAWKSRSDRHITANVVSANAQRLSAAEFARQVGHSPPRRRRSSAPRPAEQHQTKTAAPSRAQIPLISLSLPTEDDQQPEPVANKVVSPRRKSEKKMGKKTPSNSDLSVLAKEAKDSAAEKQIARSPKKSKSPMGDSEPAADDVAPSKTQNGKNSDPALGDDDIIPVSPRRKHAQGEPALDRKPSRSPKPKSPVASPRESSPLGDSAN